MFALRAKNTAAAYRAFLLSEASLGRVGKICSRYSNVR